jgi:hypothetical protein
MHLSGNANYRALVSVVGGGLEYCVSGNMRLTNLKSHLRLSFIPGAFLGPSQGRNTGSSPVSATKQAATPTLRFSGSRRSVRYFLPFWMNFSSTTLPFSESYL